MIIKLMCKAFILHLGIFIYSIIFILLFEVIILLSPYDISINFVNIINSICILIVLYAIFYYINNILIWIYTKLENYLRINL